MEKNLSHLQPQIFSFLYNDFLYEGVSVHEYYPSDTGLHFSGNFLVTLLTPRGTLQTTIDAGGYEFFAHPLSVEVRDIILKEIEGKLPMPASQKN